MADVILPRDIDIWYCQGCGELLADDETLRSSQEVKEHGRTDR